MLTLLKTLSAGTASTALNQIGGNNMKIIMKNPHMKKFVLVALFVFFLGMFLSTKTNLHAAIVDGNCDGDHTGWTPLPSSGGALAAGNYYLNGDVTLTQNISISSGTYNIDLNGNILRGAPYSEYSIFRVSGGTLNIYDCNTENKVHSYKIKEVEPTSTQDKQWNDPAYSNKLFQRYYDFSDVGDGVISGGIITGGHKYALTRNDLGTNFAYLGGGSAFLIGSSAGTVNFYGGTISGNSVTALSKWGSKLERSGAVGITSGGTFNLYDGQIVGNSSRFYGAAIYLFGASSSNPAKANIYGGIIKDNYLLDATYNNSGVNTLGVGGAAISTDNVSYGSSVVSIAGAPIITDNIAYDFATNSYISTNMSYSTESLNTFKILDKLYTEDNGIKIYAQIGLWGGQEAQLTTGYTTSGNTHEDVNKIFFADDKTKAITYNASIGEIRYATSDLYTLTYNSNNGLNQTSNYSFVDKISVSNSMFQKDGHIFIGWNTKADGSGIGYAPNDIITMTENHDLYAMWSRGSYRINYQTNGGTFLYKAQSVYTYGEIVFLDEPVWAGKVFDGWYDNPMLLGTPLTIINPTTFGNQTLYAKWTGVTEYTITSTAGLNGSITPEGSVIYDGTSQDYVIEPANGYKIATFTVDGIDKKAELVNHTYRASGITSDTDIDVTFEKIAQSDLTVYASSSENGNISPKGYSVISSGSNITYTFNPNQGYEVEDVLVNGISVGSVSSYTFNNVTSSQSVFVKFKIKTSTLTLYHNGGTYVGDSMIATAYIEGIGTELPLAEDMEREHYIFGGWYNNETFTGLPKTSVTQTDTGDKSFWAKWIPVNYTITFDSNGGSSVSSITLSFDTDITAPTNPTRDQYIFIGWSPSLPSKMPGENVTLVAQWESNLFTLSFETDGGTEISNIELESDEDIVVITNPTKPNHTFSGWYTDSGHIEFFNLTKMPAHDVTLYAKWTENRITGITAENINTTYDGSVLQIEVEGLEDDDIVYYNIWEGYSLTNPTFPETANTTVYYKVVRVNYFDYEGSVTVRIYHATMTNVTVTGYTGIYDGQTHDSVSTKSVTTVNNKTTTWTYKTGNDTVYQNEMPKFTNVGEYTVYYRITAQSHTDYLGSYTVTITPLDISDAVVTLGPTLIYTGNVQMQNILSVMVEGLNITYTVSGNQGTNHLENGYQLTITGTNNFVGTVSKTWNIEKAYYDMSSVTLSDVTMKANGNTQSITISGVLPEGVSVSYSNNNQVSSGIYLVTAHFIGDLINHHEINDMTATLTLLIPQFVEKTDLNQSELHDVEITCDAGFDPDLELEIQIVSKESVTLELDKNNDIVRVYQINLLRGSVPVSLTNNVEIRLLIPNEILGQTFKLFHDDEEITYEIEDEYAVFTVSSLSDFTFVVDRSGNVGSLVWFIIILFVLVVAEVVFLVLRFVNKNKNEVVTMSTFNPFLILLIIPTGQVVITILLVFIVIGLGIYDLSLYYPKKFETVIDSIKSFSKNLFQPREREASLEVHDVYTNEPEKEEHELSDESDEQDVFFKGIEKESGLAILVRYKKSFTAKLIQSPDETKNYYSKLKNAILSYKNVNSHVSWNFDRLNKGKQTIAKFNVRGHSLYLYLALNPSDYEMSKYGVEKVDSKKYADVPCLYKIKNQKRFNYALDLIRDLATKYELKQMKIEEKNYSIPNESTEVLVEFGLVKELISKEKYEDFLKQQKNKPANEAKPVFIKASDIKEVEKEENIENDEVDDEQVVFKGIEIETGLAILVRYRKSFTAKLIQSPEDTKNYYSILKNTMLSYKKVNSHVSWNYDRFNKGKQTIAKFNIRGRSLYVYLALNPDDYNMTKYHVETVESKKFADVPCLYKVKNNKRLNYTLDLISDLALKYELEQGKKEDNNYILPYQSTEALLEEGLVKELISKEKYEDFLKLQNEAEVTGKKRSFIRASEVDLILKDEVATRLITKKYVVTNSKKEKGIINIDTISEHFLEGENVNLEALKEKGLLSRKVNFYKVLSRGNLDKSLKIEANEFSIQAAKMILLTGGKVVEIV